MRTLPPLLLLAACVLAAPAQAQLTGPDTSGANPAGPAFPGSPGSRRNRPPATEPGTAAAKPAAPGMKIPPEIWPRLDRGATVCDSLDALRKRAAMLTDGERHPMPPGCRPVADTIKITVLDRESPGATQVRVDSTHDLAWTDAWLPEKAPFLPGQATPRPEPAGE